MKRHKDETMAEFDKRLTARNSKRDMASLKAVKKLKAPKDLTEELRDKILSDCRKARKERKERKVDAVHFAAAEKEYARECREDDKTARRKKRRVADRWDYQVGAGGRIEGIGVVALEDLPAIIATVDGTGLDLSALRIANIARSESKSGFNHPLNAWSVAEWANAMQAEAGEAGNVAKKLIRLRYGTRGNRKGDKSQVKLARQLAQEVADAMVYADLLLASEGISLSDAVRDTFNRKSKEIGFKFKL